MSKCNYSSMDGELVNLAILTGQSDLGTAGTTGSPGVRYLGFDGEEEADEFFNARGRKKRRKSSRKRRSSKRRKSGGFFDKALNAFQSHQKTKQAQAQANASLASSPGMDLSALSMAQPPMITNQRKPMSNGLKWGLIIGGVVVLGTVGFFVYKSTKGKKSNK
jgi:hypothetical protein